MVSSSTTTATATATASSVTLEEWCGLCIGLGRECFLLCCDLEEGGPTRELFAFSFLDLSQVFLSVASSSSVLSSSSAETIAKINYKRRQEKNLSKWGRWRISGDVIVWNSADKRRDLFIFEANQEPWRSLAGRRMEKKNETSRKKKKKKGEAVGMSETYLTQYPSFPSHLHLSERLCCGPWRKGNPNPNPNPNPNSKSQWEEDKGLNLERERERERERK